jgi:hypothetical protein
LAVALFAVPVMAQQGGFGGDGGVDILAQGIFETDGNAFHFPAENSANIDSLTVGNDRALAFGPAWKLGNKLANAENNLEIKKNQQSDAVGTASATAADGATVDVSVGALLDNIETIKLGNREALAFGSATAKNNMKIVTNQMGSTGDMVNGLAEQASDMEGLLSGF